MKWCDAGLVGLYLHPEPGCFPLTCTTEPAHVSGRDTGFTSVERWVHGQPPPLPSRSRGTGGREPSPGRGAMAITDKPLCPARPRPPSPAGALPPAALARCQAPPRRARPPAGGDGWSGTGRGRGRERRGEMSRSLRETGENRKPAGRGGAALASPSPPPASPRRAAAAAPWGASSPAAGSRPRAASCRCSSKREPGKMRPPASRRRRSTAGTCEPRYRPGGCGMGLGLRDGNGAGWSYRYRLSQWAASRSLLLSGFCAPAGSTPSPVPLLRLGPRSSVRLFEQLKSV